MHFLTKHRQLQAGSLSMAKRSYPVTEVSGGVWEVLPCVKVRRGGSKEIPLIQGKEQQLRFAGAAVKRYPMSKVRETQVRR